MPQLRNGDRGQGHRLLPLRHGNDRSRAQPGAGPAAAPGRACRLRPPSLPLLAGARSALRRAVVTVTPRRCTARGGASAVAGVVHAHRSPRPSPLRYTSPDARSPPQVTDALGRRVVPIAKAPFGIGRRETNDLRLAGSEVSRDHAEIVTVQNGYRPARPDVALRHLRQRRTGHRAHAGPRRSHPARPERRRRDGLPPRRIGRGPRRSTATTRRSATCARSPPCSKACARSAPAACWTTCCRWCSIRRSK